MKVPYGLNNSGKLISAQNAVKSEEYYCPVCNTKLIHRAGKIKSKHFAHSSDSQCNPETILHSIAKRLLYNAIIENSTGKKSIILKSICQNCGKVFDLNLPPKVFDGADEEVRVSDYICDVVGYRKKDIAIAIEVLNTHKVDSEKAKGLPVYWIELQAQEVINNPFYWNPIQNHLKPVLCTDCKAYIKHVYQIADRWNIDRNLYSPIKNNSNPSTYIAGIELCFRCKQEIPVFWWKDVPFCQIEPPQPRPYTIQYRHSKKYGGSYWANTCPNCKMIQGDNLLFLFDDAPLRDLYLLNQSDDGVNIISGKSAGAAFMRTIERRL